LHTFGDAFHHTKKHVEQNKKGAEKIEIVSGMVLTKIQIPWVFIYKLLKVYFTPKYF